MVKNTLTLKIKLRTWLVICIFGISTVFSIAIFFVVEKRLENNLLEQTKDNLNSINVLKKRLIEQVFSDRQSEIFNIIDYQKSHVSSESDLVDALSSIKDVQKIGLQYCSPCKVGFSAQAIPDSVFYRFEYGSDTVNIRVYLDYNSLGDVLKERTGLGNTGESYLVGPDFRMMSESIFYPDRMPQTIECRTEGAIKAFNDQTGVEIYPDYRGVPIIGVFRLIKFHGLNMAILTEIDLEEAMNPIKLIRKDMINVLIGILLLSLIGSAIVAGWLVKPVRRLKIIADKLTQGILPKSETKSEFIEEFSIIMQSMDRLVEALKSTAEFAHQIGKGYMNRTYKPLSEKDELGTAIMSMRDQLIILDQQKLELENQSKKYLIEGQEHERERIARDLHDGLGAMLTTMKLKLNHELDDTARKEFTAMLENAISETRNLSRNLMPSVLMDFGLFDALAQLTQTTQKSAGIKVKYICDHYDKKSKLDKAKQVYVYRLVQEALNNAVKHSDCTEIRMSLTEFDDQMNLFIQDNGKGFDNSEYFNSKGLGLKNIKARIDLLNGEMNIESNDQGTTIEINIPLE